ncbi:MAG: lipoate--protein ligase family protein [Nitrospira sp.]|nr:lipoate--protein ligase family protein [Nitrospira sp.]MDH4371242.1 lipoate--protein ligase family protein [Nitrospira sp.]MDH5348324.1 lipoate--protein ligase family protein [Nitrospira sp.]MDH5498779.1 lipoate--protein ligase family protein [Nitrospira sp.]MDH5726053.1 lipoate--protein ligase family protein [Nitrospira sp.]
MSTLRLLDLTLPLPVENLALDEALLEELNERGGNPVLRFWESDRHFVVLGRASRLADDVDLAACHEDGLPLLRRVSGGGTVLQGPGCLSYALVLPLNWHPALANIRTTNRFILERMATALRRWEPTTAFRGISDLAIGDKKISGNAQRRTGKVLLFHGTILHGMRTDLVARYLTHPVRQPDYRLDRSHQAFLGTINAPAQAIKHAIAAIWNAEPMDTGWPTARMSHAIATVLARSQEEPHELPPMPRR